MILATLLSSYPRIGDRPEDQILRRALQDVDRGAASAAAVEAAEDEMTRRALRDQAEAGLDLLSDGQIRWHDAVSHVARGLSGFRLEGLLRAGDTNTYYRQPAATGPIARERPFLVEAFRFAAAAAAPLPVKAIVTGPLTIARLSRDARGAGRRELALQIASALHRELRDLDAAGAGVIQVDEPALGLCPDDAGILALAARRLVGGLRARVVLATSFGDATPHLDALAALPVAAVGCDVLAAGDAAALGRRLAAALPPAMGVLLGVIDGRNTRLEDPRTTYERSVRPILEALRPGGGPLRDVQLSTTHGLEFLPRDAARAKLSILAGIRDLARAEFA